MQFRSAVRSSVKASFAGSRLNTKVSVCQEALVKGRLTLKRLRVELKFFDWGAQVSNGALVVAASKSQVGRWKALDEDISDDQVHLSREFRW